MVIDLSPEVGLMLVAASFFAVIWLLTIVWLVIHSVAVALTRDRDDQ